MEDYEKKLKKASEKVSGLILKINKFRSERPFSEREWSEYDRAKILQMESELRDAKRQLESIEGFLLKKNMKMNHQTGSFVRI